MLKEYRISLALNSLLTRVKQRFLCFNLLKLKVNIFLRASLVNEHCKILVYQWRLPKVLAHVYGCIFLKHSTNSFAMTMANRTDAARLQFSPSLSMTANLNRNHWTESMSTDLGLLKALRFYILIEISHLVILHAPSAKMLLSFFRIEVNCGCWDSFPISWSFFPLTPT